MTLDEAIKHAEDVADTCEYEASKYDMSDSYERHVACKEGECAAEHRQLAEWLKELKWLREQPRWIPCTPETMPKMSAMTETYLVKVGINECGEGMHTEVRTADWYSSSKMWNVHESEKSIVGEVTAWMPIPKGYQEGGQE